MRSHREGPGETPYDLVAGAVPVKGGWLVLSAKARGAIFAPESPRIVGSFSELIGDRLVHSVLAVHTPIGFPSSLQGRSCEREAKALLGRRHATVRAAPTRAQLASVEADADQASPLARSRQVAEEMTPHRQRTVFEALPELSFLELNGGAPLASPRHTSIGRAERRGLLESSVPLIGEVLAEGTEGATADQLLDAGACLWTARRILRRVAVRLPADPEWDDEGLRMEIVR